MAIYLDHAATTPVRPEVFEAMEPFLTGTFGNPSSAHSFGRAARAALDEPAPAACPEESEWRFTPPTRETRDAVWRRAGPLRNPTDLAALIPDPYPLAKAIALASLERKESRGPHLRTDFPDTDPALDGVHVVFAPDGSVRREVWE